MLPSAPPLCPRPSSREEAGLVFLGDCAPSNPVIVQPGELPAGKTFTPAELKQHLMNGLDKVPQLAGLSESGGRLNVKNALLAAMDRCAVLDCSCGSVSRTSLS